MSGGVFGERIARAVIDVAPAPGESLTQAMDRAVAEASAAYEDAKRRFEIASFEPIIELTRMSPEDADRA